MSVATFATSFSDSRASRRPTFGILSTYPPTPCGLATFSAALADGLSANGAEVRVVRIGDGARCGDPNGRRRARQRLAASAAAAADLLNDCDVAIVQHEYGVYGGADGDEVLEVLGAPRGSRPS